MEEWISELEYRVMEIIQTEQEKKGIISIV